MAHVEGSSEARPLRLVYAIDNMRLGGTELNAVRTAERLDRDRFAVSVICLKDEGPLSARYRDAGIPVQHLGLTSYSTPRSLATFARVVRMLRGSRVDIVHCQDIYSNVFIGACAHAAGARVVLNQRWAHDLPPPRYRALNDMGYRWAHLIVLNGPSHARELNRRMPTVAPRLLVLPGFADDSAFTDLSIDEQAAFRREMGVPAEGLLVGMIARLSPVKSQTTLLRAFAMVSAKYPEATLVLIGGGPTRMELEQEAATLGIAHRTRFLGEVTSKRNLQSILDVSVLSSLTEGFPNSIVEAMAAARPVVASAIDGIRDAVVEGESALLLPPGDAGAMAQALSALLGNAAMRDQLGQRGRAIALERYRATASLAALQSRYERLIRPTP